VKGTVTDEATKDPVKGAKVGIAAAKVSAATDASGQYLMKDVPNGDYQVAAEHRAYEKKSVPLKVEVPEGEKTKQTLELDIALKPLPPSVQILSPKEGEVVPGKGAGPIIVAVKALVGGGGAAKKEAIKMLFDGKEVDFDYNENNGNISYTSPPLAEDIPTKAKHTVTVTAEVTDEKGQKKTVSKTVNFTAGIRPEITGLGFNKKFLEDPAKEPLLTGQAFDEHSGPNAGSVLLLLDGTPVKMEYGNENPQSILIYYFHRGAALRGGTHIVTVSLSDNAGIPSKPRTINFDVPGPNIQLVKPVNVGKVISGDAFGLPLVVRNAGNGPAQNLRGVLMCNDRQYATVTTANASFGILDPGLEASNAPLFNVKTAQNLGNPENGEPVYANFTLRTYQAGDPKQFWQDNFSIPIYPGEMAGGIVYVKLIHGTYMSGDWPIHTANQRVCLDGTGGNFIAISDGSGNAVFQNIPPGDYRTYVPSWYTYGAKLGEYEKFVTVVAGQEARATLKGSCPYLFVWDGKDYVKDNDIYSVANAQGSVGSPFAFNEAVAAKFGYTDYYKLEKKLAERDGFYPLMLEEVRNEISHTDMLSLWVVDHASGTKVLCDTDGRIMTYRSMLNPLEANISNGAGTGQIRSLGSRDGKGWRAYNNDSIDIVFGGLKEAGDAKLIVYWKGFQDGAGKEENACSLSRPSLKVYVKSGNEWKEAGKVYPRMEWAHSVVDISGLTGLTGKVTLRITASSCHRDKYHLVDFIGLGFGGTEQARVIKLAPAMVFHSTLGDVTAKISVSDDSSVEMVPGEKMTVSFPYTEKTTGSERSFIFVSEGYYNSITDSTVAVRLGK